VSWLAERELTVGARVLVQHGTSLTKAKVSFIDGVLDLNFESGTVPCWLPAGKLALNDIGRIRLALASPLPIDSYREHRATGAFILVDDADGWTLGAGLAGSTPLTARAADTLDTLRPAPDTLVPEPDTMRPEPDTMRPELVEGRASTSSTPITPSTDSHHQAHQGKTS
jgi:sulfate adenylyltransferase subunit 1